MFSSRRSKTPQGGEPAHLAGGRGQSDSMQASRRNEQQRFDEFLKLRGRKAWKSHCTAEDLCDNSMLEDYMVYISEEYVQEAGSRKGKHYNPSTVTILLNLRMQAIKDRIKSLNLHKRCKKAE